MDANANVNAFISGQLFQAMLAHGFQNPMLPWQYPSSLPSAHFQSHNTRTVAANSSPNPPVTFNPDTCSEDKTDQHPEASADSLEGVGEYEDGCCREKPVTTGSGNKSKNSRKIKSRLSCHPEEETETDDPVDVEEKENRHNYGGNGDRKSFSRFSEKRYSEHKCQETLIMEELREKAMGLRKVVLRRFKDEKRNIAGPRVRTHKQKGLEGKSDEQDTCKYPGCSYHTSKKWHLDRHVSTHYPDPYFCPVCLTTFGRLDALDRHLSGSSRSGQGKSRQLKKAVGKSKSIGSRRAEETPSDPDNCTPCIETTEALRYEVGRDKERFNFYYLGIFEDFDMDEAHFELLAGRRRNSVP